MDEVFERHYLRYMFVFPKENMCLWCYVSQLYLVLGGMINNALQISDCGGKGCLFFLKSLDNS